MATRQQDQRLENAMGYMLRFGVLFAALVVLAGGILYVTRFHGPPPDYKEFHGAPAAAQSVSAIAHGVLHLNSQSLIAAGILLLIATPVCRVIFGVVGFTLEKDYLYTIVSLIVLLVLLWSLFSGEH